MYRRQRGITFIGWILLLIPLAVLLYAGIRLTPIYLNATKVARVFEQVRQEYSGQESISQNSLRSAIGKRFDIEYIERPDYKDVVIRKTGEGWQLMVAYEEIVPLVANVSLLVDFEHDVTIP